MRLGLTEGCGDREEGADGRDLAEADLTDWM